MTVDLRRYGWKRILMRCLWEHGVRQEEAGLSKEALSKTTGFHSHIQSQYISLAQPCDTIHSDFKVRLPGIRSLYFMADYKPVQGVSDDAVELAGEQSRPENAFIESPKIGTKESDSTNVQHRATATPSSSVINLANTVLGTGMLAMVRKPLVYQFVISAPT